MKKKLILASLIALGAMGAIGLNAKQADAVDCSLVRCMACPEGQVLKPAGNNCCRCVPAN